MRLILGLLLVVVVPLLLMHVVGGRMPREHRAMRSVRVSAPSADVFRAITAPERFKDWRPSVKKIEVTETTGTRRYRETTSQGTLTFEVTEAVPNTRLVTTIVDEGQPFGGRWTFDLVEDGIATNVTITEDGFVNPPIFRFLSRHVFGHTASLETYLNDLVRRFARSN